VVHFWYFENSTSYNNYNSFNYNNYQTIYLIIILYVFGHKIHESLEISMWNGKQMIKNDENHDILNF